MINIISVTTKKQLRAFIDFPHDLYEGDPYYVPELYISQRDLLNPNKHPFHKHAKVHYFLALNDNKVVGRLSAHINYSHNEYYKNKEGFFGFFDCINDREVAYNLFKTAENWLKDEGMDTIVGPANFSTNESVGLLIDGYDRSPVVMMPYNYPYYQELIEHYGFQKKIDLFAYWLEAEPISNKILDIGKKTEERLKNNGFTIRNIRFRTHFKEEVEKVYEIYNKAWSKNDGFVPMTREEFFYSAKDLAMIAKKDFSFIATYKDKPVGFVVTIPDVNQAFKHLKRGRLLPFGFIKLLYYFNKIDTYRVILFGIIEEYRKKGIDVIFYLKSLETAKKRNIFQGEASWILENNIQMNNILESIGAKKYKTYRIFQKPIL
ncbi:MAG: hypothetical protein WBH58_05065 [Bacteroidales bacterium]|jgi:hypothetical protein|nr:hypothetical protein [Bacteroidales bacterium]MDI9575921.1 hypothetical protein [Bacteroidota bacterium]MDD3755281.1 hypothetical protein [Bacteroidales bacterium]MDY0400919.1 hypothetical protein [Bacteroidales bacterium]HHW59753.1 hypothetical protein [Bacteroidales bacterium]